MKPKNYEVLMDIYMGVLNAPAIQFTTEDFGMCQITFSLLEDRITPYNLSNCIVRMVINGQQQDCTISDANNGKAEIVLLQSMFTEVGHVFAELQIYDATNQTMRLTTPTFKYTVRKSLMDDNTVQADANYSILQQMILNVSNADKVSSEALKIANNAKAICDDLVPKANTASQNAQEALDRAESVVTQEELAQKVTLDGNDTKFDFIENSSIGIVDTVSKTGGQIKISDTFDYSDSFVFGFKYIANSYTINGANRFLFNLKNDNLIVSCIQLGDASGIIGGFSLDIRRNDNTIVFQGRALFKVEKNVPHQVLFTLKDNVPSFFFDGALITFSGDGLYKVESNFPNGIFIGGNARPFDGKLIYNFYNYSIPAPQEIEHSFSVLNNYPSIKELHTTDSTGKTSILKLASDTDHVEDRAGRTQEQINRTFYKRMCKEMPSQNGEPITVKNGEEGYVLSAEIKGNTQLFKRAKGSQDEWIVIPNDEGRDTVAFEYKLDSTQAIISNNGEKYPIYATEEDKANKKVILIGGVGDVYDTLELKEDGSVIYTQNTKNLVLNGSENWKLDNDGIKNLDTTAIFGNLPGSTDKVRVIGDMYKGDTWNNGWVNDNIVFMHPNGGLFIRDTSIATLEEFKAKLSTTNLIVRGSLGTPIVTHIPKELVPAILTHNQTNILEAGGKVKASSFKVTVPVDKLAEIEARLQALESTTVDVVLNK